MAPAGPHLLFSSGHPAAPPPRTAEKRERPFGRARGNYCTSAVTTAAAMRTARPTPFRRIALAGRTLAMRLVPQAREILAVNFRCGYLLLLLIAARKVELGVEVAVWNGRLKWSRRTAA